MEHSAGLYLWMPEHWIQRVMPRLMLAQRGSAWPQSQQQVFPAMARTLWRALSPFRGFSLGSPPESRLPVEVDDFLSSFWHGPGGAGGEQNNTRIKTHTHTVNPFYGHTKAYPKKRKQQKINVSK